MNCQDIGKLFSEAFDDRLDPEARMRFETHIGRCPTCAEAYERFESLYLAVAALPAVEHDLPTPYPETARAFRKPEAAISPLRRAVVAAAMILVLSGIGWLAFEAGRRGAPGDETGNDRAALDSAEVVLPDYEAQKRIRSVEDGARNLATLAEIAPSYSDVEMVRVLDHASNELDRRSRLLVTLEADRLGSFHDEFRQTAGEIGELCFELNARLGTRGTTELRLRQARDLVRRRDLDGVIVQLARFGRSAPDVQVETPVDGDAYGILLAGFDQIGRRDAPGAMQFFEVVRGVPAIRNSRLNDLTLHVESFIRAEVGEGGPALPNAPSMKISQELGRALRVYRMPRQGVWFSGSANGEARFVTPRRKSGGRQTIIIQQLRTTEKKVTEPLPSQSSRVQKRKL